MQSVRSKNDPPNVTNYELHCSNAECRCIREEIETLRQEVAGLNQTVASLENTIQIKDAQLENTRRDKERLSAELKKQQRCNRNIKQQLEDERFFYQREKDFFNDELQRQKARYINGSSKYQQQQRKELEQSRDSLAKENEVLREELNEKNETTYNLCIKFLRMKHAKDVLREKLDQLLHEHLTVMAEMMEKLDEARNELNIIVSEKFQEPLPLNKAKFLQIVQRNTRLVHENATLKVQIEHLTLNIEKLKSSTQKSKTINVDARIIAKLAAQSRKRSNKDAKYWPPLSSCTNETEKSISLTKSTSDRVPVDHSGDAKLISKIRMLNNLKKYNDAEVRKIQPEISIEPSTECTSSAPEVVRTKHEWISSSAISADQTDSSIELRDVSTNT